MPNAPRTPRRYELRVAGHLDQHWSAWFGGLALTVEGDGTTTLRGVVADQSELHGLLAKVRDLGVTLISVTPIDAASQRRQPSVDGRSPMSITPPAAPTTATDLSLTRLHLMRAGYLLMGVGIALVKWPLLAEVTALQLYEGVTLCLLTALSLLAFLGLRHPVKLLPLLLFESAWKLLWLCLVAIPDAASGELDEATAEVVVSCSLVVVILAVTPWRHVWRSYLRAAGDRWR